jgi:cold-inducible RNA-binding protein
MAKKLYVGNISYKFTDEQLKQLFEEVGPVTSATIIMDKFSGRSKGFGFVEFEKDEDADAAIEKFNGQEVDGRALNVNVARPPKESNN